ncbi:unnamed protein product, partial [Staurois parvus]
MYTDHQGTYDQCSPSSSTCQCLVSVLICAYQCTSMPHISAHLSCQSVPPISAAFQCPSVM